MHSTSFDCGAAVCSTVSPVADTLTVSPLGEGTRSRSTASYPSSRAVAAIPLHNPPICSISSLADMPSRTVSVRGRAKAAHRAPLTAVTHLPPRCLRGKYTRLKSMPSMKVRDELTTRAPSLGTNETPAKGRNGVPSYNFSSARTRPRSAKLSFMTRMI